VGEGVEIFYVVWRKKATGEVVGMIQGISRDWARAKERDNEFILRYNYRPEDYVKEIHRIVTEKVE